MLGVQVPPGAPLYSIKYRIFSGIELNRFALAIFVHPLAHHGGRCRAVSPTWTLYNAGVPRVKIDPVGIKGPWYEGYVLEQRHTISSEMTGYNAYGHPEFDTKYSELGELVYRLKNRNDKDAAESIAEAAVKFITETWKPKFDFIALVPPSRKRGGYQPVVEIANRIGEHLGVTVKSGAITKTKDTRQLKDVSDYQERIRLLNAAFAVDEDTVSGKRILLVDDLYRSGATAFVVAEALVSGGASRVYMLAMTKTRRTR